MIDKIDISILLNTIFPHISKIMFLNYGNYFIQKLKKKLNVQQRIKIYQIIDYNFLEIAKDKVEHIQFNLSLKVLKLLLKNYIYKNY